MESPCSMDENGRDSSIIHNGIERRNGILPLVFTAKLEI
jgi:hypothetical protein